MMNWSSTLRCFARWAITLLACFSTRVDVRPCLAGDSFPVSIRVQADTELGKLNPIWRFFGADEPNYAYMPHGSKLIAHLGDLSPGNAYFRTHNLLCAGDGTPALKWGSTNAYREDARGKPVYEWTKHCVDRYGAEEVATWYWETWNEPNIDYWQGTPQEFHKLHDYAIDAVRRALPTARVGGPDTAGSGGWFMRDFLEHCLRGTNYANGKPGTPIDFVSFHAKGRPDMVDGHVRMGIAEQLSTIDDGFRIIASYPELMDTPIVISECDPEGCAACQGPNLAYRNGTMYSSYTAACFARAHDLAVKHGVNLEGALTWAFRRWQAWETNS